MPRLPPTATRGFEHFGRELRIAKVNGRLVWEPRGEAVKEVRDLVLSAVVIPVLAL